MFKKMTSLISLLFIFLANIGAQANAALLNKIPQDIHDNIFMIIPINHYAKTYTNIEAKTYYKQNCHLKNLPLNEKLNCRSLHKCKDDLCTKEYLKHGTAFLLNTGDELYTAWHVFFNSHAPALYFLFEALTHTEKTKQTQAFHNMRPEFLLVNQQQKIVYDSRLDTAEKQTDYEIFGDPLSTIYEQKGIKNKQLYGVFENTFSDFVKIKLDREIGAGLKIATTSNQSENTIYTSIGFAYDGHDLAYEASQGKKSSLKSLLQAQGRSETMLLEELPLEYEEFKQLSIREILSHWGYSAEQINSQVNTYGQEKIKDSINKILFRQQRLQRDFAMEDLPGHIYTTNPVIGGYSGGPLLNEDNKVVGIITNGFMYKANNKVSSVGMGAYLF